MSYTAAQKAHIWLGTFQSLTYKQKESLTDTGGGIVGLVKNFKNLKNEIAEITGKELFKAMEESLNPGYMQPVLDALEEKGVDIITIDDAVYPQDLLQTEEPPFMLYALGDVSLLGGSIISVVGSRKCTRYGEEQTEKIVKGLCENGFTVASGLAEGIDTIANKTALALGKTIAVIAGGFDHIYPPVNEKLFKEIAGKGLILSEYPPETEIIPFMFPKRNRIMAAIAEGVVMTEAGEKSGALITANLALNLGKELFVLPGNVSSPSSTGCNRLIKEMQGAMITGYEDILQAFGIESSKEEIIKNEETGVSGSEKDIIGILKRGDAHINEILEKTGLPVKDANALLSLMEIKGLIKKLPGNNFGI